MAKIIDITDKLTDEEKYVKIGGEQYKINTGKNAMIKVMAAMEETDGVAVLDAVVKLLLGDEAFAEIEKKDYSIKNYQVVVTALLAAARDITYEEAEATFRKAVEE